MKRHGTWIVLAVAATAAIAGLIVRNTGAEDPAFQEKGWGNLGGEGDTSIPSAAPATDLSTKFPASADSPSTVSDSSTPDAAEFDWVRDPEMDRLRADTHRAELRARYLKALLDIREYEKKLKSKTSRDAEDSPPKPVAAPKPKPKIKLLALDGIGAIIEVDGKSFSFAKVGDRQGKAVLKGLSSGSAQLEIDGESFDARF